MFNVYVTEQDHKRVVYLKEGKYLPIIFWIVFLFDFTALHEVYKCNQTKL